MMSQRRRAKYGHTYMTDVGDNDFWAWVWMFVPLTVPVAAAIMRWNAVWLWMLFGLVAAVLVFLDIHSPRMGRHMEARGWMWGTLGWMTGMLFLSWFMVPIWQFRRATDMELPRWPTLVSIGTMLVAILSSNAISR